MSFDPKVIEALARLRQVAAEGAIGMFAGIARDLNALDDAGVFAALDEQTDYASAEEILADSARRDLEKELGYSLAPGTVPPLDAAEDRFNFEHLADSARRAGFDVTEIQDEVIIQTPLDEPLVGRAAEEMRIALRQSER